jgi:hypothetical protein
VPGFYYYFPAEKQSLIDERKGQVNLDEIEKRFGASYVFAGRSAYPDETVAHFGSGPDGGEGVLMYPRPFITEDLPRCTYDSESQQWVKFRNYWIGHEANHPLPQPKHLAKLIQLAGYQVDDCHDSGWSVPIIRGKTVERCSLQMKYGFNENGDFVASRRPEDEESWELAGKAIDYIKQITPLDDETVNRMVIRFIGMNYYLGIGEVYALAQFGYTFLETVFVARVLASVTDWQIVDEYQKKSEVSGQPA